MEFSTYLVDILCIFIIRYLTEFTAWKMTETKNKVDGLWSIFQM